MKLLLLSSLAGFTFAVPPQFEKFNKFTENYNPESDPKYCAPPSDQWTDENSAFHDGVWYYTWYVTGQENQLVHEDAMKKCWYQGEGTIMAEPRTQDEQDWMDYVQYKVVSANLPEGQTYPTAGWIGILCNNKDNCKYMSDRTDVTNYLWDPENPDGVDDPYSCLGNTIQYAFPGGTGAHGWFDAECDNLHGANCMYRC